MINAINLNFIQNYKTSKKSIHDICGISYKTRKLQKNVFMIYAYVIHTCLDVALMEEDLHPSVISKKHLPTSAAYSQPLVEATILTCAKTYYPQLSQKNAKPNVRVY